MTSGPTGSWITPDGAYLYQIYGNASKLVLYATQPDGSRKEVTSVSPHSMIPPHAEGELTFQVITRGDLATKLRRHGACWSRTLARRACSVGVS